MSKVLVTGAGGYIGTQLVRDLIANNHQVIALDRYFFGMEPMKEFFQNKIVGVEAVCDLACLSNDPAGEMDPELTYQINRDGRIHVAKTAKKAGVSKYLISSSCSVYGKGETPVLNEESSTNPISVYAKSTLEAEQENLALDDDNFSVTSLRNATVFGLSTRMRFDLVVNLMTLSAFQSRRIIVMGGGLQWRPLVHVSDVSKAFVTFIQSKSSNMNGEIFNIGLDSFQIRSLAHTIREKLPFEIEIEIAPDDVDKRDYNVDFRKAQNVVGFKAECSVEKGVSEIYLALKSGQVDTSLKTVTVKWYQNILESKKLLDSIILNDRLL
jgi:nucleoside-diphosphate-sugar epimerase